MRKLLNQIKNVIATYQIHLFILIQLLILAAELPIDYTKIAIVLWTISVFNFYKKLPFLKIVTGFLSLAATALVIKQFNYIFSNEMVSSLILVLTCIRLIEHNPTSQERPYFLYLLGLFLAVTKFMFQIDLIYGLYAVLAFFYYFSLFLSPQYKLHPRTHYQRLLTKIFIYSTPLTLVIFIIFPRLKWDYNQQGSSNYYSRIGETGFSTELKPGSVSELNNNQTTVAFRAEFFTSHVIENELYWRGQILDRIYGLTWRKSIDKKIILDNENDHLTSYEPDYKIILEPHKKDNLFSLENTESINSDGKILYSIQNQTFSLNTILEDKMIYVGFFQHKKDQKPNSSIDRNYYLQLNRRIKSVDDLLKKIEDQNKKLVKFNSSAKIKLLSEYFIKNNFLYSTDLKDKESKNLEDFLFKNKIGFCEHYASSAAIMLRHWNIPTRIVTGYYGGRYNYAGQFWTIFEKDAHAWVEYLNEDNNWMRYDPTNVIAPDRNNIQKSLYSLISDSPIVSMITSTFDYINFQWTVFFLEYNRFDYSNLLASIKKSKEIILVFILILVLFYIIIKFINQRSKKYTSTREQFNLVLHHFFQKHHLDQSPNEPFYIWQDRIKNHFKHDHQDIDLVLSLYLKNTYGPNANPSDLTLLKKTLKKLQ